MYYKLMSEHRGLNLQKHKQRWCIAVKVLKSKTQLQICITEMEQQS